MEDGTAGGRRRPRSGPSTRAPGSTSQASKTEGSRTSHLVPLHRQRKQRSVSGQARRGRVVFRHGRGSGKGQRTRRKTDGASAFALKQARGVGRSPRDCSRVLHRARLAKSREDVFRNQTSSDGVERDASYRSARSNVLSPGERAAARTGTAAEAIDASHPTASPSIPTRRSTHPHADDGASSRFCPHAPHRPGRGARRRVVSTRAARGDRKSVV